MHVLTLECDEADKDRLIAELYALGTNGVLEEELPGGKIELQAYFSSSFPATDFTAWSPHWAPADETNWARKIMEDWEPALVGERWFLVPDWKDDPTPAGRIRLEVRPGVALGTGYHPTTQMCLEAMERLLRPEHCFFELGCGTGILCQAASLLGARRLIASDIDPQAAEAARLNLERAGVEAALFNGSVEAVRPGAADFIAANISADALVNLLHELERCLRASGIAVLSGFPPERRDEVSVTYSAAGFTMLNSADRGEWSCVTLQLGESRHNARGD